MTDDQTFHDAIEAYCSALSYAPGSTATLHVSTTSSAFDVVVERWGATRTTVWSQTGIPGQYTAPPPDADAEGCGWPPTVEIAIDAGWTSGFYLVTLTATDAPSGRETAHAGFVVRGNTSAARPAALLVLSTNTWNAYNTWGGRSLYTGGTRVSFRRPFARGMLCRPEVERDDRKARPMRWGEEPDADGAIFQEYRTANAYPSAIGSTGWFTHERRFVEWAEANGYRFDYAVSSDLEDPTALDGYQLLIDVGHDEYWSAAQRQTVEDHIGRGGHFASMSGNTMFWQVRLEDSINQPGDPRATMTCHKYSAHETDPVVAAGRPTEMTGLWADPLVNRPEWSVLAAGSAFGLYHRFGNATARGVGGFTVYRHDHWLVAGTGLSYGDVLGARHGVVGYETVGCRINLDEFQLPVAADVPGMPADVEIIAFTPASSLGVGDYPASIAALSDQGDLEFVASRLYGDTSPENLARVRYGNAVMATCKPFGPSGGQVVTVGTTDWVFGLSDDPPVAQVTNNILRRLGADG